MRKTYHIKCCSLFISGYIFMKICFLHKKVCFVYIMQQDYNIDIGTKLDFLVTETIIKKKRGIRKGNYKKIILLRKNNIWRCVA